MNSFPVYDQNAHNVNFPSSKTNNIGIRHNNKVTYQNNDINNDNNNILSNNVNMISFIVIGAGLIGPRHASHIMQRLDCSLFAIVDHSAKGPSVANDFNTLLFKNLQQLYDYCELNGFPYPTAAIVATPNHTHLEMGLSLASKGIHILVEKPLAPSPEDCKTLITYCNLQNVKLLVGHHRRFNPYIVATKDNLFKLGKLIAIQGTWTLKKPIDYFLEKPWRSSVDLGGGTLLINLIHDLDLLQYLIGPIERVYAELLTKQRTNLNENPQAGDDEIVDEGAALTIRFENGCCGTFVCSDNVTSPFSFEAGTGENPTIPFNESIAGFYRIFGNSGTLSVPDLKLYHQNNLPESKRSWLHPVTEEQIKMNHEIDVKSKGFNPNDQLQENVFGLPSPPSSLDPNDQSPIHHSQPSKSFEKPKPFDLQLDHFVNLINETELTSKCSGDDALRALLCINAVLKSIKTGLPQLVESIDSVDLDIELINKYR